MTDIEQQARELLAAEYLSAGGDKRAAKIRGGIDLAPGVGYALRAIAAALATRHALGHEDAYQNGYGDGYAEGYGGGYSQASSDASTPVAWQGISDDGVEFETCRTHCEANPDYWQPLYIAPVASEAGST